MGLPEKMQLYFLDLQYDRMRIQDNDENYLENILTIRKNKNTTFETLTNKIKSRIVSCQIPLLSQLGRNTLIKLVASAILVYNMSILRLLNKTTDSIDKMLKAFWWGQSVGKRDFNTVKWVELCKHISEGV